LEEKNFYSMRMMQSQEVPVDQGMPGLIKGLQASGKKVLALTLINSGSYGQIASMEKFRVNRLILAGYRFDKSWSGVKKQLLNQEKDVVFSKGVVLTNFSPKGDALMAFLQYAKNKPKKIILIDDRRINLKSVEAVARKNNIQFLGIEYMAAVDAKKEPINIKRARLQLDIFKKKHKWLSDGEADKYILTHSSIK
ncbi:MAG: DUF2608 domain-containing protein, partial [Gammaproteobacteria bacterium]|nr:DUF2608 domain-containing protein [Gammaproteobacteria bacterium]